MDRPILKHEKRFAIKIYTSFLADYLYRHSDKNKNTFYKQP